MGAKTHPKALKFIQCTILPQCLRGHICPGCGSEIPIVVNL